MPNELSLQQVVATFQPAHTLVAMTTGSGVIPGLQADVLADYSVVNHWLACYRDSPATYRHYRKEIERLLLWAICQRQCSLAKLQHADFEAYMVFLSDPLPRATWCSGQLGRNGRRGQPGWKPFVGPLSPSARRLSMAAIGSLYDYLVDAQHIAHNPIKLMRRRSRFELQTELRQMEITERTLTPTEWQAMLTTLYQWPIKSPACRNHQVRLQCLVALLFYLGLRISELANQSWQNFRNLDNQWWYWVQGKGGKWGKVPVNRHCMAEIARYRQHFGYQQLTPDNEPWPIFTSLKTGKGVGDQTLRAWLKQLGQRTACSLASQPDSVAKLNRFSPHWLRHLSASAQIAAGIDFNLVKENLRHANDSTTRLYVHSQDDARHAAMADFKMADAI